MIETNIFVSFSLHRKIRTFVPVIDRQTVEKIIDAANIVEVVQEFVTLKKSGANYKGLCPFHNEKTPSFMVSPARNTCHCFGCGKGGNPVSFIMEHEQMTYPEALRWLANKYHIEIKERELSSQEKEAESKRESMFIMNEWAAQYFEDTLQNHVDGATYGKQYFRSRGIRDDIVKKFRLGYDLQNGEALPRAALEKGYKEEFLLATGICYKREKDGVLIDRYAGRVIFPWVAMNGKVVGFGGRKLDAATKGVQQKYVNSPDSDIYHKDQQLYGIYQAKKAIAKEDCVYMVEGYTDVIAMHQCGIENVVANSGTALSLHQIRMLHRFTNNIVLLYDGDAAGIHAAMRGTDMLLSEGMNIKVLLFPDGDDPDSFARKHTAEDFQKYIAEHQTDFIQFKTDLLLKGVTDPIKRSEAINSIVRSISVITDQIVRATYVTDCAHRLGIAEATLINSMNRMIRENKEEKKSYASSEEKAPVVNVPASAPVMREESGTSSIERMLVQMIIRYGERLIVVKDVDGNDTELPIAQYIALDLGADELSFHDPVYNKILEEANEHISDPEWKAEPYFVNHPDVNISRVAATMSIDHFQLSKSMQVKSDAEQLCERLLHLILDFRMDYVEHRLTELKQEIAQSMNDTGKMMKLMEEYQQMQEIRNVMAKRLGSNIIA